MSQTKHTKGEWHVYWASKTQVIARIERNQLVRIAECADESDSVPVKEQEANTRLIAAAPDLLEALEGMLGACSCGGTGMHETQCSYCGDSTHDHECDSEKKPCSNGHCIDARAAIAKATGSAS